MPLKRFTPEPLVFPMPNGTDYEVPPVDIDRGWRLSELLAMSVEEIAAQPENDEDLFKLALSPELWERMRTDGVALADAWRAGMAASAHYQVLARAQGSTVDLYAAALTAAEAIWESGISPKALAEWAEASPTRAPRTAAAGASTASTSGTSSRKASTRPAQKRASGSSTSLRKRT